MPLSTAWEGLISTITSTKMEVSDLELFAGVCNTQTIPHDTTDPQARPSTEIP